MIPLLLVLIVLSVALVSFLAMQVLTLHLELQAYRQAEIDDLNARDAWAAKFNEQEEGFL